MLTGSKFLNEYHALEERMRALAESDGDVYLPNPTPQSQVDHVFICMEPSRGHWASGRQEAQSRINAGFRNFLSSMEDFLLHFAARHYLCSAGEEYHVTDLSKGAILVEVANVDREDRYDRWYPLLLDELRLIARPGARIFAVGRPVALHLEKRDFPMEFRRILHYSGQAAAGRNACIEGLESDFEAFRGSVTHEDILANAREVLTRAQIPDEIQRVTLARLRRRQLTESRLKLLFCYRLSFKYAGGIP
jgi:hypothetical protein